jgi:NADH:ubiquinone oxidoreductase subunit 2 (subunit N)
MIFSFIFNGGHNAYQNKQAEAGMKYVLFGAVASAMLYGISLIYGFTGTINLLGNELINGLSNIMANLQQLYLAPTIPSICPFPFLDT